jgi:hypothetical protein
MSNPLDLTEEEISATFQRLVQTDESGMFFNGLGETLDIGYSVISQIRLATNLIQTQNVFAKFIFKSYDN